MSLGELSSAPTRYHWGMGFVRQINSRVVKQDLILSWGLLLQFLTTRVIQPVTRWLKLEKWLSGITGEGSESVTSSEISLSSLEWVLGITEFCLGHSAGGSFNQAGPFHQSGWSNSSVGYRPLEAQSAGFSGPLTLFHLSGESDRGFQRFCYPRTSWNIWDFHLTNSILLCYLSRRRYWREKCQTLVLRDGAIEPISVHHKV